MNKTKIDWPNLDYTWNPIMGCANGCSYCYARKMNDRFKWIEDWNRPKFFPERLSDPYKIKKPSTIFVGSMCDIFSDFVAWEWFEQILYVARECKQHQFMFLTKNPRYYLEHVDYPENCWLGATITSDKDYKKAGYVDNAVKSINLGMGKWEEKKCKRFLSIEPLLGLIPFDDAGINWPGIDLIIVGAMTGPGATIPKPAWIQSIHHHNIHWKSNIKPYLT